MTLTFGAPAGGWPSFGPDGKRQTVPQTYTVYLAGPMRGWAGCNLREFDKAAERLRRLGWTVLSPAEHDRETYGPRLDETWDCSDEEIATFFNLAEAMEWDLGAIAQADAVVVLPGWEKSRGVKSELAHAERHQKTVRYYTDMGLWDPVEMRLLYRWLK